MISSTYKKSVRNSNAIHPSEVIKDKHLTYSEAAIMFNVHETTIYRWMANRVNPAKKHYRKAAQLLNTTIE